ncbi:MAG: hypothetical protein Q7K45_06785, partial [Nanoarchaeota archaeon]|nr:hypothetical protein [Nanoarchaeota archaeon]
MRSCDFENLNSLAPSTELIKRCRASHLIREGSPLWWSTDYPFDPREYLPFEEFRNRLIHFKNGEIKAENLDFSDQGGDEFCEPGALDLDDEEYAEFKDFRRNEALRALNTKEVFLYPRSQVPMSVLELEVGGEPTPFLVTARPYHPKEILSKPYAPFLEEHPIETLTEFILKGN